MVSLATSLTNIVTIYNNGYLCSITHVTAGRSVTRPAGQSATPTPRSKPPRPGFGF